STILLELPVRRPVGVAAMPIEAANAPSTSTATRQLCCLTSHCDNSVPSGADRISNTLRLSSIDSQFSNNSEATFAQYWQFTEVNKIKHGNGPDISSVRSAR